MHGGHLHIKMAHQSQSEADAPTAYTSLGIDYHGERIEVQNHPPDCGWLASWIYNQHSSANFESLSSRSMVAVSQ